ncbi:MAG TPA: hypothetical protein VNI01_02695 [Elusimicrobiota bacterium]|jgi:hypothetical protein|nr:hypothetical protein [Elusimicrobiota bacterium]
MRPPRALSNSDGQILPLVLVLLLVISTLVPVMVYYTQYESRWTAKESQSTRAFHLAEAGIEKGYLILTQSTGTWVALQNQGTQITGFKFDRSYTDLNGGSYTVGISSGPQSQQATIVSIGIDALHKELRGVQAIYSNAPISGVSVYGASGVDVSGNNLTVEWGSVMSPNTITPNGSNHPSYWSSSGITGLDTDASPPNCDSPNCWWWHSYYAGIPPAPVLDFNAYQSSAVTSGTGPCGSYYVNGNKDGTCSDSSGKVYYVTGNWTNFDGPIVGTVIILGNLTTGNGVMHGTDETPVIPQKAWKEYCNDWSFFNSTYYNTGYSQCPGIYSSYTTPASATYAAGISPVVLGMLYVGGDFTGPTGGGNSDIVHGVLYVKGQVYLNSNSHCKVWYNNDVANNMLTVNMYLVRTSWKDVLRTWPTGLAY